MPYWRLSGFYFFYFALLGAIMPFWPLYLSDRGLDAVAIGLLGAILMGTKVISPYVLGWLADKSGQPMRVIRIAAFLSMLFFMGIFAGDSFFILVLVVSSFSFFWNAVIGQFEAVTMASLGSAHSRYGQIRAWGSIGFILAVTALGWLFDLISIRYLPVIMSLLLLSIWISSLTVSEPAQPPAHEDSRGLGDILSRHDVIAFFVVCFLLQLSHGPYYTFYSLHLEEYGYSKSLTGILWGVGVLAELLMFLAMYRMRALFNAKTLLMISLCSCVLRWLIVGLFAQNMPLLWFGQLLHATTFAAFHAVAVDWVRQAFGHAHQGQGQALYSAISFGAGGSVGAIFSGLLWNDHPLLVWLIAAAAGAIAAMITWRYIPARQRS